MRSKLAHGVFMAIVALGLLVSPEHARAATSPLLDADFNDYKDLGCQMPPDPASNLSPSADGANQSHCGGCQGMAVWWISQPFESLWLSDEPLNYLGSSGQRMTFRWTYEQREHPPGDLGMRELDGAKFVPIRVRDQTTGQTFTMTNAAWCHNWWSEIVFWDTNFEAAAGNPTYYPPANPTNAFWPFTSTYEALVFRGDGGSLYFNGGTAATPNGMTKPTLQIMGETSGAGGPEVPLYRFLGNAGTNIYAYAPDANGMVWVDNPRYGFRVVYPDGSQDVYGFVWQALWYWPLGQVRPCPYGAGDPRCQVPYNLPQDYTTRAYLTQRIDPQGRVSRPGYQKVSTNTTINPQFVVRYVVDPDGRTNTYYYNPSNESQLQYIVDAYGRTNSLGWDAVQGTLASITDGAGLTSSFQYQPATVTNITYYGTNGIGYLTYIAYGGAITNLTTPYGSTGFGYYAQQETNADTTAYMARAVLATEPEGARQLFYYLHNAQNGMATNATAPVVAGYNFDSGGAGSIAPGLNYRNTLHWDRRQFAALSGSTQTALETAGNLGAALQGLSLADCQRAALQHWLLDPDGISITDSVSSRREPSPDVQGQIEGPRTWFDYAGKPSGEPEQAGTQPLPGCLAQVLPDGTTNFVLLDYAGSGFPSVQRRSYSLPGGGVGVRTNWFQYAANGIDLIGITNSAGQWVNLGYNTNHQPVAITNALNQVATLSWDLGTRNLTGMSLPDGQTSAWAYYPASGSFASNSLLQSLTLQPQGRIINITAYTNGLPQVIQETGTGLPALWLTNTWDGLNRLTGTLFQDGSTVSNIYTALDLTGHKDRMGNWTHAGFDGLEHLTSITNANNGVTLLSWCGCGALTSITDALTNTTSFFYNNQGLLTNTLYPDGSSVARAYDSAERLTSASDGLGRTRTFFYNNQGLVTTVSNAVGSLEFVVYDALDRPIQITDANNVTITNQYDLLDRLIARIWPDGVGEGFGWAANGLVAYTNRDNQITRYGRDAAGRRTSVTNANLEVVQFGYNALDQVISLIDGLNHTTTWNFNQYGWLTNKINALSQSVLALGYNANGWVTNRWTPQMGNTTYTIDAVGNVLAINYPLSTNSFAYDALSRLTNMVDGVGASAFGYTATGQLQSETGPWPSNGVSFAYTQGLRTSFSIDYPLSTINYSYDSAWRLTGLSTPAGPFSYAYDAQRFTLPTLLTLGNYSTITNHYDPLARLDYTALISRWGNVLDGQAYQFDPLGLRTNIVRYFGLGSNSVSAGYDAIGQLTSWKGQESTGLPRWNEQLNYGYDAAHNLSSRTNADLVESFILDPLNELTNETRTGALLIAGATPAPATNIVVAGQAGQSYSDFTFASTNAALSNGMSNYQIVARNAFGLAVTNNLSVSLPPSVGPQYDANGSLTNDGTRAFVYDPENRLTNVNVASSWKSEFAYDGLGRRRIERDYSWQSGAWNKTNELHFIYDGWLMVQVRDASNNVLVTYTRGLDLSGTRTRAGGIGGLLARTDGAGSTYYHNDGEGNITALIDGYQLIQARYLYDPFGRLLGQWGPLATGNSMQFSSMPYYRNAGIVGYWGRFYDPGLQRWLNQDPIGEQGGINLYRFVGNSPPNFVDPYGLLGAGDFNLGLLFDSQAWGQLAHDLFHGDDQAPPLDPLSQQALANSAGVGNTPLTDENGNPVQPGDLLEKTMAGAAVDVLTTALPGAPEEEGAYAAADKLLKGAEDAAKAGKKCLKPRTPAENKKARNLFKNNKEAAKKAYEDRTGLGWDKDETGKAWPAHHPDPLADGGDPMYVEPQNPQGPDPHNIPGPDGLTDYQRWGARGAAARNASR